MKNTTIIKMQFDPKTIEEIVLNGIKIPEFLKNISGVYFLLFENRIVYVGKSNNIPNRIAEHIKNKIFDKYYIISTEDNNEIGLIEAYYIILLLPKYNIQKPDSKYIKTLLDTNLITDKMILLFNKSYEPTKKQKLHHRRLSETIGNNWKSKQKQND